MGYRSKTLFRFFFFFFPNDVVSLTQNRRNVVAVFQSVFFSVSHLPRVLVC